MKKSTETAQQSESDRSEAAFSPVGKVLQLPGGMVYYQEEHEDLKAAEEGANLLDLQTRQDSIPLFSTRTKRMIDCF